jgi:hypothetical protein
LEIPRFDDIVTTKDTKVTKAEEERRLHRSEVDRLGNGDGAVLPGQLFGVSFVVFVLVVVNFCQRRVTGGALAAAAVMR